MAPEEQLPQEGPNPRVPAASLEWELRCDACPAQWLARSGDELLLRGRVSVHNRVTGHQAYVVNLYAAEPLLEEVPVEEPPVLVQATVAATVTPATEAPAEIDIDALLAALPPDIGSAVRSAGSRDGVLDLAYGSQRLCDCESVSGRFGAHHPECPVAVLRVVLGATVADLPHD